MHGKARDDLVSYDFTERWQSGRMCRIRNPVYRKVPGVRIPLSPLVLRGLRKRRIVGIGRRHLKCHLVKEFSRRLRIDADVVLLGRCDAGVSHQIP